MKIKSQKKTQRILNFYYRNFGVGRPYTVLVDGTFCSAALEARIPIKDQIPTFLDDKKTRIVTTPCIIMEVEKLGKIRSVLYATWLVVKQFAIVRCGHEGKPLPASQCIKSLLDNNPRKYVVALQDKELKHQIHESMTGTPIISLNQRALVLGKPTEKCEKTIKQGYSSMSQFEEDSLKAMKRKYLGEEETEQPKPKKKKLSKKRNKRPHRKLPNEQPQKETEKKGRGRHRKKKKSSLPHNITA